jgi:hypothetical protein
MAPVEWAAVARWAGDLTALLDAGGGCEKVAGALLGLLPEARAVRCQLDGATANAGAPLPQTGVLTATVESAGRSRGTLSAAPPEHQREAAERLLAVAARLVGLALPPDPRDEEDHRRMMELVTVGEAAGWLIHALNNHLNGMVLQAACVQMQTQPPIREQAEHIRREGARAAARLRPLQAVRPWPAREGERVDLVAAVRHVLAAELDLGRLRAKLPAEELLVSASVPGMRRLLTLLFRVVLRCVGDKEGVAARAGRTDGHVELEMDLPGVRLEGEEEGIAGLPPEVDAGLEQLEREAARWLVRQTGGALEVVQGPEAAKLKVRWEAR